MDLKEFPARVVSNLFDFWDSEIPKNNICLNWCGIAFILWSNYAQPKFKIIGLGVMDMSTRSEYHEKEEILDFWKVEVESY